MFYYRARSKLLPWRQVHGGGTRVYRLSRHSPFCPPGCPARSPGTRRRAAGVGTSAGRPTSRYRRHPGSGRARRPYRSRAARGDRPLSRGDNPYSASRARERGGGTDRRWSGDAQSGSRGRCQASRMLCHRSHGAGTPSWSPASRRRALASHRSHAFSAARGCRTKQVHGTGSRLWGSSWHCRGRRAHHDPEFPRDSAGLSPPSCPGQAATPGTPGVAHLGRSRGPIPGGGASPLWRRRTTSLGVSAGE